VTRNTRIGPVWDSVWDDYNLKPCKSAQLMPYDKSYDNCVLIVTHDDVFALLITLKIRYLVSQFNKCRTKILCCTY
jgi:hypothetical protein